MALGTDTAARISAPIETCIPGDVGEARRARLEIVVGLARIYRRWSATDVAAALGRPPGKIAPRSGNPKLDLVARLADAIDWELGDLAESLWFAEPPPLDDDLDGARIDELDAHAQLAHRRGDFQAMEAIGLAMRRIAATPSDRATAANRLAGAYDGMGRFPRVLACVREGLAEHAIGIDIRTMLTVNLANAHSTLWNLREAESIASALIGELRDPARRTSRISRVAWAHAHAVRGHALRRNLVHAHDAVASRLVAVRAEGDLLEAERLFLGLWEEYGDAHYRGLANTALGGAVEAGVAAGRLDAREALEQVFSRLDAAVDPSSTPVELAESLGWWSVYGANIAFRAGESRLSAQRERSDLDRAIAICTNKAIEIAEHLDHWAMRERAFTLEWSRRERRHGEAAAEPWSLDDDDIRVLVGTMGRFPLFRPTGWAILGASIER
ncbi:MAG: hypothetical protein LW636_06340 [Planctomycetaceae bacterium]|nr:hypothetical protein [Planctomycetaceae bacterium]